MVSNFGWKCIFWSCVVPKLIFGFASYFLPDCRDINGSQVRLFPKPGLGTAAATYTMTGVPVIVYDPTFISSFSQPTKDYIYLHECGHLALGHSLSVIRGATYTIEMEDQADVYATYKMGLLGYGEYFMESVHAEVSQFPADIHHRPGPIRSIFTRAGQCTGLIIRSLRNQN